MKTKYIFTSLALASTLFFASCKDDRASDEPIQRDTNVEHLSPSAEVLVDVSQGKVTATTCELTFTPRKEGTKFISLVMPREVFNVTKESELSNKALEQLTAEAKVVGKSLGEYLSSIEASGKTTRTVKGLMNNTAYSVVTLQRDGDKLKPQLLNDRFYFSTAFADKIDLTFETKVKVKGLQATLNVMPNKKDVSYFLVNIPKTVYNSLLSEEKMSDEQIVYNFFQRQLYSMLQYGTEDEMEAAKARLLYKGDHTFGLNPDKENTEYVYLLASIYAPDPFDIAVTSEVTKGSFTSGQIQLIDCTFDIKTATVDDTHFSVTITPSKNNVTYVWRFATLKSAGGKTPEQLANDILAGPLGPWDRSRGKITQPKLPFDQKGAKQYIIAFGFQGKTRVTEIAYHEFTTGTAPDPNTLSLSLETTAISPFSASIKFTPSDKSIYFAFQLRKDGTSNVQKEKEALTEDIKEGWAAFQKANPNIGLERYIDLQYYHDVSVKEFTDLEPSTSYTLYTYAISQDDGSVVKVEERTSYLTTPEVSDATVTPELYGVFDADIISTDLISDIEQVQDRGVAIVVVKYNFSDNAVGGYGFLLPKSFREVELNPEIISDKTIRSKLKGKFLKLENRPGGQKYGYYACFWGQEQVSLTYAVDANSGTSKILREKLVTPVQSKADDVSKLRELINKLNAKSSNSGNNSGSTSLIGLNPLNFDWSKAGTSESSVTARHSKFVPSVGKAPLRGETEAEGTNTGLSPSEVIDTFPVFIVVR